MLPAPQEELARFVGKPVIIRGLKSKAILNGCVGKALSYDHETGRIAVQLSSPPVGEPSHVKVKPDNLLFDSARRDDVPELDEKQPRDWLYREGIDPPAAWSALWRLEQVEPNSPAARPSPCQCQAGCPLEVCYALDAVTCWRCKRSFDARHVPGFEAAVAGSSLVTDNNGHHFVIDLRDVPARDMASLAARMLQEQGIRCRLHLPPPADARALFSWGSCPCCSAQLGVSALPKAALSSAGHAMLPLLAGGVGSLIDGGSAAMQASFVKVVCAEVDYCLRALGQWAVGGVPASEEDRRLVIDSCTRGICCVNLLRAVNQLNFTLTVADNYYKLHYLRSRFEGSDRAVRRAIRSAVSNFSKRDTSCLDVQSSSRLKLEAGGFPGLFLTPADWSRLPVSVQQPAAMDQYDCRGPRVPTNPMQWPPSLDATYSQLDAEQRGMVAYLANANTRSTNNTFKLSTAMEFRWAFHQVASAKAYFTNLKQSQAETEPGLGKMRCTPEPDLRVDGISEMLVTRTRLVAGERQPVAAFCCVLRVGRVCAKLYVSGLVNPGHGLEQRTLSILDDVLVVVAAIARRIKAAELRAVPAGVVDLSGAMAAAQLQEPRGMGSWLPEGEQDDD